METKVRMEYREYRQYLRDHFVVYERKQVNSIKPLSYEEWKRNKPIYKVGK